MVFELDHLVYLDRREFGPKLGIMHIKEPPSRVNEHPHLNHGRQLIADRLCRLLKHHLLILKPDLLGRTCPLLLLKTQDPSFLLELVKLVSSVHDSSDEFEV